MTTVKAYIQTMRAAQNAVAPQLGSDMTRADLGVRARNTSVLAMIAVLMKTLTDNAVITDAQLQAVLNAAVADVYAQEAQQPPPPP